MPFGRAELVLAEQVRVQEGQLHRVADLLDLRLEATDVGVVDVGHLLQDQFLDLALGDPLVGVRRARLDHERVAGPDRRADERLGEVHDALLVGVGDHQCPVARCTARPLQDLLEHHHLADPLVAERVDDVERVVEQDLLAAPQLGHVQRGRDGNPELAATGEDVHRPVVVSREENAVATRRLREAVDLLLERHDLRASLLEGAHQPVVVLGQPRQLCLGGRQPLFELPDVSGAFGQLAPHQSEFLLKERDLRGEIVGLLLPPCGARVRVVAACHVPPPRGA